VTTLAERRSAAVALGLLSAALLAAGLVPWLVVGPLVARLIAVPFGLLGVLGVLAAAGLPSGRFPHKPAPAPPGRAHHCTRCAAHTLSDPVRVVTAPDA
jgi:hypothetical protein